MKFDPMTDGRRIALGSAQFGQRYGVANRTGAPTQQEIERMLARARDAGVDTVDTAIAYGDSEAMLGRAGVAGFRVVSKLPPLTVPAQSVERWVREHICGSIARLRVPSLSGLLLHCSSDAVSAGDAARELRTTLAALKVEGFVVGVGASVYEPAELDALVQCMTPDIVQLPYNVLDRRFAESGWLQRLRESGAEIHVRSVFLQGLLLLDETEMPTRFTEFSPTFASWRAWLRERRISALAGALGFALANPLIDRVVVGAESAAQLDEILAHASTTLSDIPNSLKSDDIALINPVNWPAE